MKRLSGAAVDAIQARVDGVLDAFLAEQRGLLDGLGPEAAEPLDELSRVIGAGGKRLRPLFCYWGYRAAGCDDGEAIVRAAASLELLHTFAIIHDDVMDRSPLRRGQAATHLAMAHGGDAHAGVSAAILVGDLALALADVLLVSAGFPPETFLAGYEWYNRMRTEVVTGQYLDLAASRSPTIDEETARRIASLKSGGYTVEKPLLIGAALGGAAQETLAVLSAYGMLLGEAFQLRDDVLGAFGDPAVTGKDADGDLREGKRTLLVARALEAAVPEDRAFLAERLGDPELGAADSDRIRAIFRTSGALASTQALIDAHRNVALAALDATHALPPDAAAALTELADLAVVRDF
ncbi:MAG: polyprenyl synthetase family protein [Actinomycetota bacterium]